MLFEAVRSRDLDTWVWSLGAGRWLTVTVTGIALFGVTRLGPAAAPVLAAIAIANAWLWLNALRRYRAVADTPTARVASAPQGYVEMVGRGRQFDGVTLNTPHTGLPCLWYRYKVERRDGDRWEHVDAGQSQDTFLLDDGTGLCVVDPDAAEIVTTHREVRTTGEYRQTEELLLAGDPLYALGMHRTVGGATVEFDTRADVSEKLAEWKRDRAALARRFDANRDGDVDLAEWEQARRAAEIEVAREHDDMRARDGIHMIRAPGDGRQFLIANQPPEILVRHFLVWAWVHLGLTLVAAGFAAAAIA